MAKQMRLPTWVWPIAVCLLVLAACYVVIRQQASPLTVATQWIGDMLEGFQSAPMTSPRCPSGYTFFTDATGESLCCKGTINPFTHTCRPTPAAGDSYGGLCAFRPDVPSPSNPSQSLPLCAGVIQAVTQANGAAVCPPSLPVYASGGDQRQSCCKTATNLDGTDCTSTDLTSNNFCRVNPTSTVSGRDCAQMRLFETSGECPAGLQKGLYTIGSTEKKVYPNASGVVPACFGMQRSCFPDSVVASLQQQGTFTSQPADPKQWAFSCSGYQKFFVDKDMSSPQVQMGYLKDRDTNNNDMIQ